MKRVDDVGGRHLLTDRELESQSLDDGEELTDDDLYRHFSTRDPQDWCGVSKEGCRLLEKLLPCDYEDEDGGIIYVSSGGIKETWAPMILNAAVAAAQDGVIDVIAHTLGVRPGSLLDFLEEVGWAQAQMIGPAAFMRILHEHDRRWEEFDRERNGTDRVLNG